MPVTVRDLASPNGPLTHADVRLQFLLEARELRLCLGLLLECRLHRLHGALVMRAHTLELLFLFLQALLDLGADLVHLDLKTYVVECRVLMPIGK